MNRDSDSFINPVEEQHGDGDGTMGFVTLPPATPIHQQLGGFMPQAQMAQGMSAQGMSAPSMPNDFTDIDNWGDLMGQMGLPSPHGRDDMGDLSLDSDASTPESDRSDGPSFQLSSISSIMPSSTDANADASASPTEYEAAKPEATLKPAKRKRRSQKKGTEEEQKQQTKQRNRVAASKCREKKKNRVHNLEEVKSNLEMQNNELQTEYQSLRDEIGRVKSHLIDHTNCNDPNINRWIQNEAHGYVQTLRRADEGRTGDGNQLPEYYSQQ